MSKRKKVTAWSISRYKLFKSCPYRYVQEVVMGNKAEFTKSPAIIRGEEIHKKAERFLLGDIPRVPPDLKAFADEFNAIKEYGAEAEIDLAVTKDWLPSSGTDWDNVWLRAAADARVLDESGGVSSIIDYKTGKIYPDHEDQGEIYAMNEMCHQPEVSEVDVEFWYIDQEEVKCFSYSRKELPKLKRKWKKNSDPLFTVTNAEPTPNYGCRWCHLASDQGGPCKYDSKGRK